jgi:hypothetical protein
MSLPDNAFSCTAARLWPVLALVCCAAAFSQDFTPTYDRAVSSDEVATARATAEQLLTSIDRVPFSNSQMADFYNFGGLALRSRYTFADYVTRLQTVRYPLGTARTRVFSDFSGAFLKLPNIIVGDYVIVGFKTRFSAHKGLFTEQVTLEHDRSGAPSWRFVEYYVAPLVVDPNR